MNETHKLVDKWLWEDCITPTSQQLHGMMTVALTYAVKKIFSTHGYRYGGKYYIQGDWGPIGHILTCVVARLVMIWFDLRFKQLVLNLGINLIMFLRYVDDMNTMLEKLRGRVRFNKLTMELVNDEPNNEN